MVAFSGSVFAESVPSTSPDVTFWIKFSVTFHRPKLDCKQGFGLCFDVEWGLDGSAGTPLKACPVKGCLTDNNKFLVQVNEEDLARYENGSTLSYFKGKNTITLEDPYTFSPEVSKKLGSPMPITIKPGVYPVSYSNRAYTITFSR